MNLMIHLSDDKTEALNARARAKGVSAEEYAAQVLEEDLSLEWLQEAGRFAAETGLDQMTMDEIDAEIAAARKSRRTSRVDANS